MKITRWTKTLAVALFSLCVLHPGVSRAQPSPPALTEYELNTWNFDGTNWLSPSFHNYLVSYTNVVNPPDWDGNALLVDTNVAAWLQESIVSDSQTNMTFGTAAGGTIEFWFMPDWSSGTGPGDWGRFIDVGADSSNSPSWFSLYLNPQGTNIYFSSETNGVFTNYLTYAISWTSNQWHLVDVTYAASISKLYVDGQLAATGAGVFYEPDDVTLTNGFFIGSDITGEQQMRGEMDNLATYNYAISGAAVANNYTNGWDLMNGIIVTNSDTNSYTSPSYGTNLYIAQISLASGYISGFASNTLADVSYQLQYVNDLTQTNWISIGSPILGSELTNWTPLNYVAMNPNTNMFFRLQSQQSGDDSGLPTWWELEYLGQDTNVDPNALDSAGDGWTLYQKYELGDNPNVFATPGAPQNVAVAYNAGTGVATVSWQPAPGNVTGYTITDSDGGSYTVSAATTNIQINATNSAYLYFGDPSLDETFQVEADYYQGNSTTSSGVPAETSPLSGQLVPGPSNAVYVVVSGLPTNTASLSWIIASYNFNTGYAATTNSIPLSSLTNGFFLFSSDWPYPVVTNGVISADYWYYLQASNQNGNVTTAALVYNPFYDFYNEPWNPPFYDGREQMKQNLIFQLRVADTVTPFGYINIASNPPGSLYLYSYVATTSTPTNYVYAGFYDVNNYNGQYGQMGDYQSLNVERPFEDNYLYRNFVYTPSDVDTNGYMTTGVQYNGSFADGTNLVILQPPVYVAPTNLADCTPLLDTNTAEWLCTYAMGQDGDNYEQGLAYEGFYWDFNDNYNLIFSNNVVNYWGLPFVSATVYYYDGDGNFDTSVLDAGNVLDYVGPNSIYMNTAQPQLQTVEYDFWNSAFINNNENLPGNTQFSPTNTSGAVVVGVGQIAVYSAYEKLALQNGFSGVYGYVQQYLDSLYEVDTNGNVTTNLAGIVSPYGTIFATNAGFAALTTMPDPDTGQQGTDIVYAVGLAMDKNHDGIIDTSFNGPDTTTANSPFVFWANNNYDRWDDDFPFNTPEQDDQEYGSCPYTPYADAPDCDYLSLGGLRVIPCTRDLEDFARLWVLGVNTNLLAALPAGSTITLNWGDVGSPNANNPTIDLFQAADADGGIGYLTNETVATEQTNTLQNPYVGRLAPGGSVQLNASQFNGWAGSHFIWCGVSNGTGGLNLTIRDANSNLLAQTTAYIKIVDIKQMYERWTVGDNGSDAPTNIASLATENLPPGAAAFQYPLPTDTNTPYILFVHGWKMPTWLKDRYAEAAFKRLYWQGYQGRFGSFRWPTGTNPTTYDPSESNAWASAVGLLNKLNDLNAEYPGQVYVMAHSMGNVVVGEALRQTGSNQVVNTYIAMQGAVPAHAYDPTTPNYATYPEPDCYADYWTNGAPSYFSGSAGAGTYVNFLNTNDYALNIWLTDQYYKPDALRGYGFDENTNFYYGYIEPFTILTFPTNTYQIFSFADPAWSYALGAQLDVGGSFKKVTDDQIELDAAPYNFSTEHIYHSFEFRSDSPSLWPFWSQVLVQMNLK